MPSRPRPVRFPLASRGSYAILCCSLLLSFGAGCRALRCTDASDAALAAARRQSLQALDAQQRGQWDQAETLFAAAIEQCPADERARHGYAHALWQRGAHDEAIAHMEEAVRLSGNDPERMVELGSMYLHRGQLHRAADQADRAIAADPQLAAAWVLRGQSHQSLGQSDNALASLHRALSLRANYPEAQLAIAAIYTQQDRPQRALATLQALSDSHPPDQIPADVLIQEAFAFRALGRHSDSAAKLALATERGNASADLYYELARSQSLAGNTHAARDAVSAALARDATHAASLALAHDLLPRGGTIAAAAPLQTSRMQ